MSNINNQRMRNYEQTYYEYNNESSYLGIYRFTDGAKDAQAGEIVSLRNIVAVAHQRSDSRGSRVKVSDLVAVDHIPIPACVWVHGRAWHWLLVLVVRSVD